MEMEEEEGYDEVVEKVVKRLAENDLYIKPEKCKWKAREVRFLEVVIVQNTEVFGISQLLLEINQGLCIHIQTIVLFSKEGSEVRLDGEAGEGIEGVEEEIHKRTNVSSIRSRQKNKDGSRCM